MQITNAPTWLSVGWMLALIVLLLVIVFYFIGKLSPEQAGFLAALAVARLIP